MRRQILYLLASVLMVAGEPAIGATLGLPHGAPVIGSSFLSAPVRWIVSTIRSRFEPPAPPIQD
jgi:hypothetical protein